jgi:hypothetical protein
MTNMHEEDVEVDDDTNGLVKILENKQNQITKLENKIRKLEDSENMFTNKKFSETIEKIELSMGMEGKSKARDQTNSRPTMEGTKYDDVPGKQHPKIPTDFEENPREP